MLDKPFSIWYNSFCVERKARRANLENDTEKRERSANRNAKRPEREERKRSENSQKRLSKTPRGERDGEGFGESEARSLRRGKGLNIRV